MAIDELKATLFQTSENAEKAVSTLRETFEEMVAAIRTNQEAVQREAKVAREAANKIVKEADTLPTELSGIVRNYRFGFPEGSESEGLPPTHRFEVEIPGAALVLSVNVPSNDFDLFLMDGNRSGKVDLFRGNGDIEGQTITVRRDTNRGLLVPVCFGTRSGGRLIVGVTSQDGGPVYEGDLVAAQDRFGFAYPNPEDNSMFQIFLTNSDGDPLNLGGAGTKRPEFPKNGYIIALGRGVTRVIKRANEGEELLKDQKGTPLFKGDVVRLRPRRVFGARTRTFRATIKDYSEEILTVRRDDRATDTLIPKGALKDYEVFQKTV